MRRTLYSLARTTWLAFWLLCLATFGQAADKPALWLAQSYSGGLDLSQYWVSEKYDGVRGYWDGHALWTRQGEPINAPAWFSAGWPATPIEGELWAGRGEFALAQKWWIDPFLLSGIALFLIVGLVLLLWSVPTGSQR